MSLHNPQHASICHASREDVHHVFALIKELAAYEKAEDQLHVTEELLIRTLTFPTGIQHSNPGYAKTLLVRLPEEPTIPGDEPGAVAGMAVYFHNYSTWRGRPGVYLEDLFVRPQYRKRGYGKLLLQELSRETLRIGGARLDLSCLNWNESSLKFYRSLGAKEVEGWTRFRLEEDTIVELGMSAARAIQRGEQNGVPVGD